MSKEFDFQEIGKRTPFRTPEGFFERVQAETMRRIDEERRKQKMRRIGWGISLTLAAAAMICGFLFLPATSPDNIQPSSSVEWVAQMSEGADPLDLYIQELTDEELEEWIEFSENDVYYELTTENLNEDED